MPRSLIILLCFSALTLVAAEEKNDRRIQVDRQEGRLVIRAREERSERWFVLANYVMPAGQRPYLHPVYDPSGTYILTQDRPDDHPWQHGIFTGFHRVNGFNYWKEDEGRQRFVRLLNLKEEPGQLSWTALIELVAPNGQVVLEEENTIVIHAPKSKESYVIEFGLLLRAKDQDVQFGKFFVGGLSVRMPWDKERPRQTHLNSNGLRGRAGEQQRAAWCTVEQPFDGNVFGFAIFDHPQNAQHPPSWRVDEQGLINPNVSGLGDWSIPAGQTRHFNYELLVYRGSGDEKVLRDHFERFTRQNR